MPSIKKAQMKIPLVDLRIQYRLLEEQIKQALSNIMESSSFIRGPELQAFEQAFAAYHGVQACVGLNSGTDALFLLFRALGVQPGDEILTVPFTFVATAEAIVHAGATVKFVDIDPERFTLDPALLEKAMTSKTVGIVPVHLYGTPADLDPILAAARARGLWVVEDACQAHGALYKGKKAGTLGHASAFSFYPSKNLGAYGDGGAVITSNPDLAEKVRKLRDHGQVTKYHSEILGFNSRLDAFQAAILKLKLPYLDEWNEKRRQVASWYEEALTPVKAVRLPSRFADSQPVYHLYVVRVPRRDELARHLEENGVSTGIHYAVPLHQQVPFQANGKALAYPVSEQLSAEVLSLPMYPELSREEVHYVARKMAEFYL